MKGHQGAEACLTLCCLAKGLHGQVSPGPPELAYRDAMDSNEQQNMADASQVSLPVEKPRSRLSVAALWL